MYKYSRIGYHWNYDMEIPTPAIMMLQRDEMYIYCHYYCILIILFCRCMTCVCNSLITSPNSPFSCAMCRLHHMTSECFFIDDDGNDNENDGKFCEFLLMRLKLKRKSRQKMRMK